jgi:hypothetical protein
MCGIDAEAKAWVSSSGAYCVAHFVSIATDVQRALRSLLVQIYSCYTSLRVGLLHVAVATACVSSQMSQRCQCLAPTSQQQPKPDLGPAPPPGVLLKPAGPWPAGRRPGCL